MPFQLIPDFNSQSRIPKCSVCGNIKQKGDRGVFRGGHVEYEGSYDVCEACIREASSALGIMHEAIETIQDETSKVEELQAALAQRDATIAGQAAHIASLTTEDEDVLL